MPRRTFEGIDWRDEVEHRRLSHGIDQVIGAAVTLVDAFRPPYGGDKLRLTEVTNFELFADWSDGIKVRGITATPGRLINWLSRAKVPVLLTTAFLGMEQRVFAAQIGLSWTDRHPQSTEIRSHKFGSLKFVYFSNLASPVEDGMPTSEHHEDVSRVVRSEYDPTTRMLILTPGYKDINEIADRLPTNMRLLIHRSGSNINDLRQQLIRKPGILLTVYWEGFNIVEMGRADKRHGIVDKLVITRLPYSPPNPALQTLFRHVHPGRNTRTWAFRNDQTQVCRRVHQGFMRLLRGRFDRVLC